MGRAVRPMPDSSASSPQALGGHARPAAAIGLERERLRDRRRDLHREVERATFVRCGQRLQVEGNELDGEGIQPRARCAHPVLVVPLRLRADGQYEVVGSRVRDGL